MINKSLKEKLKNVTSEIIIHVITYTTNITTNQLLLTCKPSSIQGGRAFLSNLWCRCLYINHTLCNNNKELKNKKKKPNAIIQLNKKKDVQIKNKTESTYLRVVFIHINVNNLSTLWTLLKHIITNVKIPPFFLFPETKDVIHHKIKKNRIKDGNIVYLQVKFTVQKSYVCINLI